MTGMDFVDYVDWRKWMPLILMGYYHFLKVQDLVALEEVVRMVLEIINSSLSHSLQHNPNLIYTLLYQKELFTYFRTHPTFQDIIQNVDTVGASEWL